MKENLLKHRPTQIQNNEIETVYENEKITIIYPKKFGKIESQNFVHKIKLFLKFYNIKTKIDSINRLGWLWLHQHF